MSSLTMTRSRLGSKLRATLLAGALATGGLFVAQAAVAPNASAAVCGYTVQSDGYAYANNGCGYAQAEVGRYTGGKYKYATSTVYKKATSVSWTAGSRWYEFTARW